MYRVAKLLPAMLSVLMVPTSVSVSACDLSCWLNQASPECHSASPGAKDRMTASSMMEMSAEMEMGSHAARIQQPLEGRASSVTRHLMFAPMKMTRRAPEVISKTEVSAGATFDHSKALSPCSHEMCSQDATSSSPSGTSQSRSPGLHWAVIRVSIPANPLTSSNRMLRGAPPLMHHPADLLSPLRI
jgi:hypothetical protein